MIELAMMRILRLLFVGPTIRKKIVDQQLLLNKLNETDLSELGLYEGQKLSIQVKEIEYSINVLESML